jgi:hypothetical protein
MRSKRTTQDAPSRSGRDRWSPHSHYPLQDLDTDAIPPEDGREDSRIRPCVAIVQACREETNSAETLGIPQGMLRLENKSIRP